MSEQEEIIPEVKKGDIIVDEVIEEVKAQEPPKKEEPSKVEEPSKEEEEIDLPERVKQKVKITDPISTGEKLSENTVQITLPGDYQREMYQRIGGMPNVDIMDTEESRHWAQKVREGNSLNTVSEQYVDTLEDPDKEFAQYVDFNNQKLGSKEPKFQSINNQVLKGERAVLRLISHLGLGTIWTTALWHSGFYITFKPPGELDLVELNRLITADKINLGRWTYGLALSNTSSYTTDRLVDFILDHVYQTSLKPEEVSADKLRDHIVAQDIPSLIWGFVCTMYPRGFRYSRPCVNNPDKCNYVLEDTLNLRKLQFTAFNTLTDWQKAHMSSAQAGSMDLASIKRYRDEMKLTQKHRFVINEGKDNDLAFLIKSPSVTDYVNAGHRWISNMVQMVDEALGMDVNDNERNRHISRFGQATVMRHYSHWIDAIEVGTNIIDNAESIEKSLDTLSTDDDIREAYQKAINDYINKSTISVIGINTFHCPKCSEDQSVKHELTEHQNIIPLDTIQLFFALLTQKLERVSQR